jgi:hypothetical protein
MTKDLYAKAMRRLENDPTFKRMDPDAFAALPEHEQIRECCRVLEAAGLIVRTGEMQRSWIDGEMLPVYVALQHVQKH